MERSTVNNSTPWVQDSFVAFQKSFNSNKTLNQLRESAFEVVQDRGFPSTKLEDWKYTNISSIAKTAFVLASKLSDAEALAKGLKEILSAPAIGARVIFVNGRFSVGLSEVSKITELGVSISELQGSDLAQKHLGKYALNESSSFVALNTAFIEGGIVLHASKNVAANQNIEIIYFTVGDKQAAYPRLLVLADDNTQLTIVERFLGKGNYLNNYVAEIVLGQSARVDHYKIQEESTESYHLSRIETRQETGSNYENHSFVFGAKLIRNEINPVLQGEKAYTLLHGLNILNGDQHVDNHTVLDHAMPNCDSREWYKGIYSDKSKGVFCGTIIVRADAQKTNAFQSNQSLLLSDEAESNSKPQLKIWADDVKCSHGATVGQLDKDALFYLRSRGISKKDAQSILITAFAGDILGPIKIAALKQELEAKILEKLNC